MGEECTLLPMTTDGECKTSVKVAKTDITALRSAFSIYDSGDYGVFAALTTER